MQEEIESRSVNLAVSTTKLTMRTIVSAVNLYLRHRKEVKAQKSNDKQLVPTGKQTVKELIGQGQGVSNIDIARTDLRGFENVARKYGVEFSSVEDGLARCVNDYLNRGS